MNSYEIQAIEYARDMTRKAMITCLIINAFGILLSLITKDWTFAITIGALGIVVATIIFVLGTGGAMLAIQNKRAEDRLIRRIKRAKK